MTQEPTDREPSSIVIPPASERLYLNFIHHMLLRGWLSPSLRDANTTTMAGMMEELGRMRPGKTELTDVMLGRVLRKAIDGLYAQANGLHRKRVMAGISPYSLTTVYRFPELLRARASYERYVGQSFPWKYAPDEWQSTWVFDDDEPPRIRRLERRARPWSSG